MKSPDTANISVHTPQEWAALLFREWGADATLFVGGRVFDCIRSEDRQGEFFWRAVYAGLVAIIEKLRAEAEDVTDTMH